MLETIRRTGTCALFLLLASGSAAGAQTLSLEGAGGLAVPTGELADMTEASLSVQVAAAYPVHDRIHVRAMGALDMLTGKDVGEPGYPGSTPDVELWSGGAGLEVRLTPDTWPWAGSVHANALVTSFNTEVFEDLVFDPESQELVGDFAETYFTMGVGLRLGYEVRSRLTAFLGAEWRRMFADEDDTAVFGAMSPDVEAFDSATWIPVTAGVRYAFRL